MIFIPFWILAFRFLIIKPLLADSFRNSNVAPIKQNGINYFNLIIFLGRKERLIPAKRSLCSSGYSSLLIKNYSQHYRDIFEFGT